MYLRICAHRLSSLFGVAEGLRDFGFDVGGSPLPRDDVGQQVHQHVVVLQERHCAVLPVVHQVGSQESDVYVDLTGVLTLAGLETHEKHSTTNEVTRVCVRFVHF